MRAQIFLLKLMGAVPCPPNFLILYQFIFLTNNFMTPVRNEKSHEPDQSSRRYFSHFRRSLINYKTIIFNSAHTPSPFRRNHKRRRNNGDKRRNSLRPGHDVSGERAPGGAGPLHDDALLPDRAPGLGRNPEGHRRHHREPGVSAATVGAARYQRRDDLGTHRTCPRLE